MATKPASVTEKTFDTDVLKAGTPVLVDFWATWCGPCKMIAPIVEEIAGEYEGKLRVMKLDVDENSGIAARYSIMSIPTGRCRASVTCRKRPSRSASTQR